MSKTGVWATAADSGRLLRVSPITAYCTLTLIVFQWAYKLSRGETMCPADREDVVRTALVARGPIYKISYDYLTIMP